MNDKQKEAKLTIEVSRKHQDMLKRLESGSQVHIDEALDKLRSELQSFINNKLAYVIESELEAIESAAISRGKQRPGCGPVKEIFATKSIHFRTPQKYKAIRPIFSRNDNLWWRNKFIGKKPELAMTSFLLAGLSMPILGIFEGLVIFVLCVFGAGAVLGPTLRGKLLGSPIRELNEIGEILRAAGFRGFVTLKVNQDESFKFELHAFYDPDVIKLN